MGRSSKARAMVRAAVNHSPENTLRGENPQEAAGGKRGAQA